MSEHPPGAAEPRDGVAGEPVTDAQVTAEQPGDEQPTDPELARLDDPAALAGALEALLVVVDEPVPAVQLAQLLARPVPEVVGALERLSADYAAAGRGFELRRVGESWRLYSSPDFAPYVERYVRDGRTARLTQAALETLAIIAYRQPVARARVSAIRGVNVDGVVRTLVLRGLVEEAGTEPETGAVLYATTTLFLERLGLDSADDLPPLGPLLPELDEGLLAEHGPTRTALAGGPE